MFVESLAARMTTTGDGGVWRLASLRQYSNGTVADKFKTTLKTVSVTPLTSAGRADDTIIYTSIYQVALLA